MSLLLRDLLFDDYDRTPRYAVRPYRHLLAPQPVRVHKYLGENWPLSTGFDQALNELQNVMESVNDAIGQYQNSLLKDISFGGMKTNRTEDGTLQLALDVSQYKPEEVSVRLCDDNLVIEAKTESSENDSYHKAEFKRWVKLPQDVKQEAIKSTLTPDRKLVIEVPCNKPIQSERSRAIPIDVQKQSVESGDKQNEKQQTEAKGQK